MFRLGSGVFLCIIVLLMNSHLNTYYSGIPCTVVKTSDVRYDSSIEQWLMTVTVDIHGGRYIDHKFSSNVYNVSTAYTLLQPGTTMSCVSTNTLLRSNNVIILDPADIAPYYYYLGVVNRMLLLPILLVIFIPCLLYPLNV